MLRHASSASDPPAPSLQLLSLVGDFLSDFGFTSTRKQFSKECKSQSKLHGWEVPSRQDPETDTPKLEDIYRRWHERRNGSGGGQSSSSDSDDGTDPESSSDDGSSEGTSVGSSDAIGDSHESDSSVSGTTSSSSESESDAEDDTARGTKSKTSSIAAIAKSKAGTAEPANTRKRKAEDISSVSTVSESESSSGHERRRVPEKKPKRTAATSTATTQTSQSRSNIFDVASSSSTVSSSSSSSGSDSKSGSKRESKREGKLEVVKQGKNMARSGVTGHGDASRSYPAANGVALPSLITPASDSSATVNGEVTKTASSESSSPESMADSRTPKADPTKLKKHQGAKRTPLAELSAQGERDAYLSNQYQPYAYADRAYNDLSVTRGKGFTKEKNKKKRGSYRGGAIDTAGGKGFKFED